MARETLGSDVRLMVDAGGSDAFWPNGLRWARRTAEMLARYDVAWFEEPLAPDALADFVALRRDSPIPIAGGETLTRRQAFQPWLEAGAFDIVQPDVTKVGGISEERRIAWLAQDHGIRFIPHGWNTALGLAADLQLASAIAGTDLVEYLVGSPYIDGITRAAASTPMASCRFRTARVGVTSTSSRGSLSPTTPGVGRGSWLVVRAGRGPARIMACGTLRPERDLVGVPSERSEGSSRPVMGGTHPGLHVADRFRHPRNAKPHAPIRRTDLGSSCRTYLWTGRPPLRDMGRGAMWFRHGRGAGSGRCGW